jgi:hypothetical protein
MIIKYYIYCIHDSLIKEVANGYRVRLSSLAEGALFFLFPQDEAGKGYRVSGETREKLFKIIKQ